MLYTIETITKCFIDKYLSDLSLYERSIENKGNLIYKKATINNKNLIFKKR